MKKSILILLMATLILSVIAVATISENRLSIRAKNTDGFVYISEDRYYETAKLSLTISRIKRDWASGYLILNLGERERLTVSLLDKDRLYISEFNNEIVVVNQNAKVKHYKDGEMTTEIVGVQYSIFMQTGTVKLVFPWNGSYFIIRMDNIKHLV